MARISIIPAQLGNGDKSITLNLGAYFSDSVTFPTDEKVFDRNSTLDVLGSEIWRRAYPYLDDLMGYDPIWYTLPVPYPVNWLADDPNLQNFKRMFPGAYPVDVSPLEGHTNTTVYYKGSDTGTSFIMSLIRYNNDEGGTLLPTRILVGYPTGGVTGRMSLPFYIDIRFKWWSTVPGYNYYVAVNFYALPLSFIKNGVIVIPDADSQGLVGTAPLVSVFIGSYETSIGARPGRTDHITVRTSQTSIYANATTLEFWNGSVPPSIGSDPYDQAGTSTTGGGGGNFTDTNVPVSAPSLPSDTITGTSTLNVYNPSPERLSALVKYLWTDNFDLSTFKKIVNDPISTIIGAHFTPFPPVVGGSANIQLGNIQSSVTSPVITKRYVEVDCGAVHIDKYSGSYLDYSPYTKYEIFLPFIGSKPINADDITGKDVQVIYHGDVITGACMAYIVVDGSLLYSFSGQASSSIPITGDNFNNAISWALTSVSSLGSLAISGGATAPMAANSIASASVNAIKPTYERTGDFSSTAGFLGPRTPFIIKTRPRYVIPDRQNEFTGYPVYISSYLSELSGYTEIEKIHLTNIPATSDELSELEALLKEGVIF